MASPQQFARRISALAAGVEENSGEALRDAAAAAGVALVRTTPVGGPPTSPSDPHPGLARSNWQISLVGGGSDVVPETSEINAINRILGQAQALDRDGQATISNPVPHINRLNAGWSSQAPALFVNFAIAAARAAVARVRLMTTVR